MIKQFLDVVSMMRVKHWSKNLLVFAGLFFANAYGYWPLSLLVFASFCAAASFVYILNDIVDIKSDRLHPSKKHRVIASGRVSVFFASTLAAILLGIAIAIAWFVSNIALALITSYIVINILYSLLLKNVPILDVFIIASGFVLRALIGTIGIGLKDSAWFLAAIIAISLFLVFSKRLHEKQLPAKSQRVSLAAYSLEFLKQCVMVTMVIAICFYALYVIETRYDYYSYFSIMVVLFGFLRYLHLVDQQKVCGDPVSDFFSDKALMISVALWIALFYLGGFIA